MTLSELQAAFSAVQEKSASQFLSERNVVEILMKLISRGDLTDVVFSLDGREYVTLARLEAEISAELDRLGGRLSVVSLQEQLNVDIAHVERAAARVVAASARRSTSAADTVIRVGGEIVSGRYLDRLADEVQAHLDAMGEAALDELARRFGFSTEFLSARIFSERAGRVRGTLAHGTLYTDAFVARQTALLRGVCRALTRPTPLTDLRARFSFHAALFLPTLEGLLRCGEVNGVLHGRGERATFVPAAFNFARLAWLDDFVARNHYVDYAALERQEFAKPRAFLAARFPDGVALKTCFAARPLVELTDALLEDTATAQSWADVAPLLPSMFAVEDIAALLYACPAVAAGRIVVLGDSFVVSPALVTGFLDAYERWVLAETDAGRPVGRVCAPAAAAPPAAAAEGGRCSPATGEADPLSHPPPLSGAASGRVRQRRAQRGARRRRGAVSDAASAAGGAAAEDAAADGSGTAPHLPSDETAASDGDGAEAHTDRLACFRRFAPDAPEEFVAAAVAHVRRSLAEIESQAARRLFLGGTSVRDRNVKFQQDMGVLHGNILFFARGAAEAGGADALQLERYLLRTLCMDLVDATLENVAFNHGVPCPPAGLTALTDARERRETRRAMLSRLSAAPESDALRILLRSAEESRAVGDFVRDFELAAPALQLRLRPLDERRDAQLRAMHHAALVEQMRRCLRDDLPAVLHLVCALLVVRFRGRVLHFPGHMVPSLLAAILPRLPAAERDLLTAFQASVVAHLSDGGGHRRAAASARETVDRLKDLVLPREDRSDSARPKSPAAVTKS